MTKGKKITTIADLAVNDVFSIGMDGIEEYRILSVKVFFKRRHMYGALAMKIADGPVKTKAFQKNEQVVYLRKMIAV